MSNKLPILLYVFCVGFIFTISSPENIFAGLVAAFIIWLILVIPCALLFGFIVGIIEAAIGPLDRLRFNVFRMRK